MADDGRAIEGWPTEPLKDVPGPDPFPWDGFGAMIRRTPRYLRLAWLLAGEPSVPKSRRAGVIAAAAYLASPVDLVPGIIPVVGQLDDMAIAMLALRAALRSLDEPTRTRVLAESNLVREDLDADIATIGATAGWLIRRGVRVSARLMRLAAMAGMAIGRVGIRVGIAAGRRGLRIGSSAARTGVGVGSTVARAGAGVGSSVARTGVGVGSSVAQTGLDAGSAVGGRIAGGAGAVRRSVSVRRRRSAAAEPSAPA